MKSLVNYQEIEKAYSRISNYTTKTPLLSSDLLNKQLSSKKDSRKSDVIDYSKLINKIEKAFSK